MRRARRAMDEPRLEIMPLIDVIFLLLTFFVFALTLMVRAETLDIRLPSVTAGDSVERVGLITVAVREDGGFFVDGERVERDQLVRAVRDKLDALEAEGRPARVLVAADELGRSGDLLAALDLLAAGGVGDVSVMGSPAGR